MPERWCLALFVLIHLIFGSPAAIIENDNQTRSYEAALSDCAAKVGECDDSEGPVCGTDDQTYPTRCHLSRIQCTGEQVSLKYRGACKACALARQYAQKHRSRNPRLFVPRCRRDGNYAPMQCFGDFGCWCSDSNGKPIENTSMRLHKPKCRVYRRENRRRSPPRQLNSASANENGNSSGPGVGHSQRSCSKTDRITFNNNLVEIFRSEYLRSGQSQSSLDATVLNWKFGQLDGNANQMLDKQEVRELKKLVKRAVKPRRCGRTFNKYCDVNKDERLSRLEWSSCLAKDGSNERNAAVDVLNMNSSPTTTTSLIPTPRRTQYTSLHTIHTNLNSNSKHDHHTNTNNIGNSNNNAAAVPPLDEFNASANEEHRTQSEDYAEYENEDGDGDDEDNGAAASNNGIPRNSYTSVNYPSFYFLNPKTEPTNNESEGDANCWTDKELALEEQKHGDNGVLYVPECTHDGRYQRVQCYQSTPYCWCVNEDTGKNIPGTSVKNKRPQCDDVSVPRPMKGCSEPRKTIFLKELKEFLKTQILSHNTGMNTTTWKSEDERIAKMSFVFLDKNKNKLWERKEWKVFRELVTSTINLRKCGKKMPRYCDVNGDKKISLNEWLDCLQSKGLENATTTKSPQSNETATSRLLGSNPLEQYLKD